MPDITLRNFVEEWLANRWGLRVDPGTHITGPCECGHRARYAAIFSDGVVLVNVKCECVHCQRTEIKAGDPQFFDLLQKSLEARITHKSVIISNHLQSEDDVQHAVEHFKNIQTIYIEGKIENQSIDLKDAKLIINNGSLINCEIKNINNPIVIQGYNNQFIGCSFYMGTKSPYWANDKFRVGMFEI